MDERSKMYNATPRFVKHFGTKKYSSTKFVGEKISTSGHSLVDLREKSEDKVPHWLQRAEYPTSSVGNLFVYGMESDEGTGACEFKSTREINDFRTLLGAMPCDSLGVIETRHTLGVLGKNRLVVVYLKNKYSIPVGFPSIHVRSKHGDIILYGRVILVLWNNENQEFVGFSPDGLRKSIDKSIKNRKIHQHIENTKEYMSSVTYTTSAYSYAIPSL